MRIFKLAKIWDSFSRILEVMAKILKDIMYFGIIIFLFMLMFTVLGMKTFGGKVMFDGDGQPVPLDVLVNNTE